MSDLLSAFIVSIYAAVIGSSVAASGTQNDVKAEKGEASEVRRDAKTDFKRVEQKADVVYKAAIADCRKRPSIEKNACLEKAKSVNDKVISEAKAANEKAVYGTSTQHSAWIATNSSRTPE